MTRSEATSVLALIALCWVALALTGCSLRPQPEPPPAEPEIELGLISAVPSSATAVVGGSIEGAPGAAPAGALLRAFNLENQLPPNETIVRPDGSFLLTIDMTEGDEVRLQAIVEDARSRPLDILIGPPDTPPEPATRALADCLSVRPSLQLDLGVLPAQGATTESIRIANGCDAVITIGAAQMRRFVDGLTIDAPSFLPVDVPSGQSVVLSVQYLVPGTTGGHVEEVLLIEVTAPQRDRRPVTIFADVRP